VPTKTAAGLACERIVRAYRRLHLIGGGKRLFAARPQGRQRVRSIALSTLQEAGIVVVSVTALVGVIFAAFNAWLAVANERKRTQPIVMAHEVRKRHWDVGGLVGYWHA